MPRFIEAHVENAQGQLRYLAVDAVDMVLFEESSWEAGIILHARGVTFVASADETPVVMEVLKKHFVEMEELWVNRRNLMGIALSGKQNLLELASSGSVYMVTLKEDRIGYWAEKFELLEARPGIYVSMDNMKHCLFVEDKWWLVAEERWHMRSPVEIHPQSVDLVLGTILTDAWAERVDGFSNPAAFKMMAEGRYVFGQEDIVPASTFLPDSGPSTKNWIRLSDGRALNNELVRYVVLDNVRKLAVVQLSAFQVEIPFADAQRLANEHAPWFEAEE